MGATSAVGGADTVIVAPSTPTTGSTTERWSWSTRWVIDALRISTTDPPPATSAASASLARVTVMSEPVAMEPGVSTIVGRSPRKRYGGS